MSKSTGLLDVSAVLSGGIVKVNEIEKKSDFYPTLKLHHAIQTDYDNPNFMHLHGVAEKPVKLDEGYSLCVIGAKNSARFLCKNDDNQNFYDKVYWTDEEEPKVVKNMGDKERNKDTGRTYLLTVFNKDVAVLVEFDAFGIYNDYWKALVKTGMKTKTKMTVNVGNHRVNMIKAKSGFNYHAPKLFKQFNIEPLSEENLEAIGNIVKENIAGINDWINSKDNKMPENDANKK